MKILLVKFLLILSVFISTGYNNHACASPQVSFQTELLVFERFTNSAEVLSLEKSTQSSTICRRINLTDEYIPSFSTYNIFATLILKTSNKSFLAIKSTLLLGRIRIQSSSTSFPEETPI